MDVLWAAPGDEKLTFLGQSYGTQLGAVYAEQFPERVRATILDGVFDPHLGTAGWRGHTAPRRLRLTSGGPTLWAVAREMPISSATWATGLPARTRSTRSRLPWRVSRALGWDKETSAVMKLLR
ncbi:pimeloyl-ACP methyl ester carboxylesterase [Streptosporangium lutulentum]|uniref:Pimeloyl-ACP methyl ester carboxylesterase n=1 Tax=Streptosporangium lutulentum TaxID=1461250 RepID=A0ABT9Q9V4_9ACTN|nr:pimeloyl-ACP methyl ester carboxylesterase [Streptosporangium lutulentum]